LQARPELTQVKHLSVATLWGRLLASPTNIRLGWKGMPGTNTLAYYKNLQITAVKSFISSGPWCYYVENCFIGLGPSCGYLQAFKNGKNDRKVKIKF
jgi:hypothetical protein